MKKLYYLSLLILFWSSGFSQEYLPFADSSSIWINHHENYEFQEPNPIPIVVSEHYTRYCAYGIDTLIDGQVYSMINYCEGSYKGAIRDDNGKVYFIPNGSFNELLLYDFTVDVGDTVVVFIEEDASENYWTSSSLMIYGVDTISVDGVDRRRINLEGSSWIEGIGNTYGLFNESFVNVSMYSNSLHCMSIENQTLYPEYQNEGCDLTVDIEELDNTSDVMSFYPNPSRGFVKIEISVNSKIEAVTIVNMMGKECKVKHVVRDGLIEINIEDYPDGIYFVKLDVNGVIRTKKLYKITN